MKFEIGNSGNLVIDGCLMVHRTGAAELAKVLQHYADTGSIEQHMKRWALGWAVNDERNFRLTGWYGFVSVPDGYKKPVYFESYEKAVDVREALGLSDTDVEVLEVTVVERDGRLVEV